MPGGKRPRDKRTRDKRVQSPENQKENSNDKGRPVKKTKFLRDHGCFAQCAFCGEHFPGRLPDDGKQELFLHTIGAHVGRFAELLDDMYDEHEVELDDGKTRVCDQSDTPPVLLRVLRKRLAKCEAEMDKEDDKDKWKVLREKQKSIKAQMSRVRCQGKEWDEYWRQDESERSRFDSPLFQHL